MERVSCKQVKTALPHMEVLYVDILVRCSLTLAPEQQTFFGWRFCWLHKNKQINMCVLHFHTWFDIDQGNTSFMLYGRQKRSIKRFNRGNKSLQLGNLLVYSWFIAAAWNKYQKFNEEMFTFFSMIYFQLLCIYKHNKFYIVFGYRKSLIQGELFTWKVFSLMQWTPH